MSLKYLRLILTTAVLGIAGQVLASNSQQIKIETNYKIGKHPKFGEIELGGFSGLTFSKSESKKDTYVFYSLTDRGPNAKPQDFTGDGQLDRPFILPEYSPLIFKIEYNSKSSAVKVTDKIKIKKPNSAPSSGIPNVDRSLIKENFDETPVSMDGKKLKYDPWGLDPESIAIDSQGNFWIGEEYGPSILKIDRSGKILGRWNPAVNYKSSYIVRGGSSTLPKVFGKRVLNAGFEGMAISGNKLYGFLQKPLKVKEASKFIRVLVFDIEKEKTDGVFVYEMDPKSNKIGGTTILDDGSIAVLEHSGFKNENAYQRIYKLNFENATNVQSIGKELEKGKYVPKGFTKISKTLEIDVLRYKVNLSEKPEGIAYFGKGKIAMINDNDFNLAYAFNKKKQDADKEDNLFIIFEK